MAVENNASMIPATPHTAIQFREQSDAQAGRSGEFIDFIGVHK
ncbi:MAG: hypothetical protein ACSLEM_01450 [Candidatus Malihini olakiniferum]